MTMVNCKFLDLPAESDAIPILWFVVVAGFRGRRRHGRLVGIDLRESRLFQGSIQGRDVSLQIFFPLGDEFVEGVFEFLIDGRRLGCGRGIRAIGDGQQRVEVLVERGKIFGLFAAGGRAEKTGLGHTLQLGGLLVQSRDQTGKWTLGRLARPLLQLRAHRLHLLQSFVALVHTFDGARLHGKLFAQTDWGSLDARIHPDDEGLRIALAVDSQLRDVVSGQRPGTERVFRSIAKNGRDREFPRERFRRSEVKIPDETVHTDLGGQNLRGANPVRRNRIFRGDFFEGHGFIGAGITADQMIFRIEDFEGERFAGRGREVVIKNRSVRRVLARGNFGRKRRVRIAVPTETNSLLRREERCGRFSDGGVELAKRRNVVENPERTPVRADDEIVAVDREVAHRRMRQIELHRLPVVAIIEGDVHGGFRAGKEQTLVRWIFANYVAGRVVGNAFGGFLPRLPKIAGAVDVWMQVVQTEAVYGGVRGAGDEVRRFDDGNFAPGLELRRRDVLPSLAGVAGDVDEPVIGAGPNGADLFERRSEGINDAAVPALFRIGSGKSAEVRRSLIRGTRQIRADDLPAISGVAGFEQDVCREIQSMQIERRKDDG